MLASAGFAKVKVRVNAVASSLAGTVNARRAEENRRAIPALAFAAAAPIYHLFGLLSGKGDMLTACASRGH
jgi:hypothetical protein